MLKMTRERLVFWHGKKVIIHVIIIAAFQAINAIFSNHDN